MNEIAADIDVEQWTARTLAPRPGAGGSGRRWGLGLWAAGLYAADLGWLWLLQAHAPRAPEMGHFVSLVIRNRILADGLLLYVSPVQIFVHYGLEFACVSMLSALLAREVRRRKRVGRLPSV